MRVLIDTTFESRGPTGTGVYVRSLIPALRASGLDVLEAANRNRRPPAGGGLGSARNLLGDGWWTQIELPRRARHWGADVLHHPLPAHARRAACPQVVTVQDLAFEEWPELFAPGFRAWAGRAHRTASRRAGAVVCASNATAEAVRARWGVPEERVVVAPYGPGQYGEATRGAWTGSASHFLYVGDDEPRKDVDVLVEGYRRYRAGRGGAGALPLILAGSARRAGPGIEVVPRPAPPRLVELYAGAAALVHLSRHEGFGLTLLEAMHVGAPVVCAASAAAREVCAGAARYVEPGDAVAVAAELEKVGADDALRRQLSRAGRDRAAAFSWEQSAQAHIRAYTLALR